MDDLGLMEAFYRVFSFSFTRFASRWSNTAKSSGSERVGPGFGATFRGALEAPDDDRNDVGHGDASQDAAVPAQKRPVWLSQFSGCWRV